MNTFPSYLSGLVDADGSIFKSAGRWRLKVTAGSRHYLDEIRTLLSTLIGRHVGTLQVNTRNHLDEVTAWDLVVSAREDLLEVLEQIVPYLVLKRDRALLALDDLLEDL